MIVAEIIARLVANTSSSFAIVEGAAALSEVQVRPPAMPAAYVVALREASGDNERMTSVLQRTEVDVAVVIITDNLSDDRGDAAARDLEALKKVVRDTLIGWQPASAEDVVTHVSGELTKAREGVVWWEEVYATALYLEEDS